MSLEPYLTNAETLAQDFIRVNNRNTFAKRTGFTCFQGSVCFLLFFIPLGWGGCIKSGQPVVIVIESIGASIVFTWENRHVESEEDDLAT